MRLPEEIWFDKYRIMKRLGKGQSADVFLAEHLKLKCKRVIKRVSKGHRYYSQLMNEAGILKNLNHPNIPIIYDMEEDEGFSYIIEEYIEGQSLKAFWLGQCNIQEQAVIEISIQVCDIFQFLHITKEPILYLDLKPDHIIIEGKTLKLIDFGASVYEKEAGERGCSLGTAGYAAPEQFRSCLVDERSDIYGIGMLMYFLAAGKEYAPGDKNAVALCPHIGRELKKIIDKCLSYYPQQRYRTVEALRSRLVLLQKKNPQGRKFVDTSQEIMVAGAQSRIGVTHVCGMLSAALADRGYKDVRIRDLGVLSGDTMEYFQKDGIRLLVAGAKNREWNQLCRCMNLLNGIEGIQYLLNFLDGRAYQEAVREMGDRECIRVPFCPDPRRGAGRSSAGEFASEVMKCGERREKRKRKVAPANSENPPGGITIGLVGTHSGVGVTHISIAMASLLSGKRRMKTACIEMNGSGDFARLAPDAPGEKRAGLKTEFRLKGITFLEGGTKGRLAELLNRDYQCRILDFGTELSRYRNEFISCHKKLVLCSQTQWKEAYLDRFLEKWGEEPGFEKWIFIDALGWKDRRLSLGRDKTGLYYVGFIPDPFAVPREAEKVITLMLYGGE